MFKYISYLQLRMRESSFVLFLKIRSRVGFIHVELQLGEITSSTHFHSSPLPEKIYVGGTALLHGG